MKCRVIKLVAKKEEKDFRRARKRRRPVCESIFQAETDIIVRSIRNPDPGPDVLCIIQKIPVRVYVCTTYTTHVLHSQCVAVDVTAPRRYGTRGTRPSAHHRDLNPGSCTGACSTTCYTRTHTLNSHWLCGHCRCAD